MQARSFFLIALFALVALFALLNWAQFTVPTSLNLVVAHVEAPFGIVMLMLLGLVTLIFMLLLARAETVSLLESRKLAKELDKARKLADSAEESRFQNLHAYLERELGEINRRLDVLTSNRIPTVDANRLPAP